MSKDKPLRIRNSTAEFLIFTRQAGDEGIEVRVAEETVWLTQKLISVLFDKGRSTITEHLKNIFESGELDEKSVCRDFRHTAEDGKDYTTRFHNLDAIIAVGCCVNPVREASSRASVAFSSCLNAVSSCFLPSTASTNRRAPSIWQASAMAWPVR
jgi:hypothetical protein